MLFWIVTFYYVIIQHHDELTFDPNTNFLLQIFNCQAEHLRVRKECIEYMKKNKDRFEAVKMNTLSKFKCFFCSLL